MLDFSTKEEPVSPENKMQRNCIFSFWRIKWEKPNVFLKRKENEKWENKSIISASFSEKISRFPLRNSKI